jgi:hypothetical protein
MRFFTRLIIMAALLFIATNPLVAQTSRSADASATVVITPVLTLTKTVDLNFGSHFNSEGIVSSSAPARWDGTTDIGNHISASFVLPSTLARIGNGDTGVPISFGTESAQAIHSATSMSFNPATGLADFGPIPAPGSFNIQLGTGSVASNRAAVDLTGHRPGTYQGIITLTVTVL